MDPNSVSFRWICFKELTKVEYERERTKLVVEPDEKDHHVHSTQFKRLSGKAGGRRFEHIVSYATTM